MAVIFYGTAAGALALDLWSKWHVFRTLAPGVSYRFVPHVLSLQPWMNEGAAFGMGRGFGPVFVAVSVAASAAILWGVYRYGRQSGFLTAGLGLLLSGALGNVYDRIFYGWGVRDFLDLHVGGWHYPAIFNVADVAICVGCGMVILYSLRAPKAEGKGEEKWRARKGKRRV